MEERREGGREGGTEGSADDGRSDLNSSGRSRREARRSGRAPRSRGGLSQTAFLAAAECGGGGNQPTDGLQGT